MVFAYFWNDEFQLNDVIYFVCGVPGMKPKRKHCIDHERLVAVLMQKLRHSSAKCVTICPRWILVFGCPGTIRIEVPHFKVYLCSI